MMPRANGGAWPVVVLVGVLCLAAGLRYRELSWGITGHPAFARAPDADEARMVQATLTLQPTLEGMRPGPWLMTRGPLVPSLGRLLYAVAEAPAAASAFVRTFGTPLDGPAGRLVFFRSLSAVASLALLVIVFRLAIALGGSGYAGAVAAFALATTLGAAFAAVTYTPDMVLAVLVGSLMLATGGYFDRPVGGRAAAMGALWALAVATRPAGVTAGVLPLVALLTAEGPSPAARRRHAALLAAGAVVAFFMATPYHFLAPEVFLQGLLAPGQPSAAAADDLGSRALAVVTIVLVPGLGVLLTVAALLGLVDLGRSRVKSFPTALFAFVATTLAVLAWRGAQDIRDALPVYPVLCAAAGVVVARAGSACLGSGTAAARLALVGLVALAGAHTFRFYAFSRLLREPGPIARATRWLGDVIPPEAPLVEIGTEQRFYGFRAAPVRVITPADVDGFVARGARPSAVVEDYVVLTEEAFRRSLGVREARREGHRAFYAELFDVQRFQVVVRFETPARLLGVTFPKGFLPEGLIGVAPDTYVFRRVRGPG